MNGFVVRPTLFPDGTSQVWNLPAEVFSRSEIADIIWRFDSEAELIHLAQLRDLLNDNGLTCKLYMPYLPYGRQDKPLANDATFALRSFAKLLNRLDFSEVSCLDPHSEVAGLLITNFAPLYPTGIIETVFAKVGADLVCYPDSGALMKYAARLARPCIFSKKERNQATGDIKEMWLTGSCKDQTILVVDDLCDGGRTFVTLMDILKKQGAAHVHLFVTHGLFTKGLEVLRAAGIERIFTHEGEKE